MEKTFEQAWKELEEREREIRKQIAEAFAEQDEFKYNCAKRDEEELNRKANALMLTRYSL